MTKQTSGVLDEVYAERERQEAKWGEQNLDPALWLMVLGEEVGEVNNAVLETIFGNVPNLDHYREELIQVAAVAVRAIENYDRQRQKREQ